VLSGSSSTLKRVTGKNITSKSNEMIYAILSRLCRSGNFFLKRS
jgi:hypothetical protein